MGEYAEDLIDGICDWQGDYTHKFNKKKPKFIKDTPSEAKIRSVRKELAILIKKKITDGESQPVENARKEINLKYGKGWRERGLVSNSPDQWSEEDLAPFKK